MSVLRRARPLLATTFLNKCGAIGLSLLPMLLVERHASTADASLSMAVVKGAGLGGMLLGGVLTDRLGARLVLLGAFALQAVGLGLLPLAPTLALLVACGVAAKVGDSLFVSPSRLLLTELIEPANQAEAIGWLRTANNAGQIVCFGVGALFSAFGVMPLMLFDSATSLVALVLGSRLLPSLRPPAARTGADRRDPAPAGWGPAVLCAAANGGFVLLYELFMVGAAGSYRLRYGESGLALFSTAMVIDTVLCALVAVVAARLFRDVRVVLPLGTALLAAGAALALAPGVPLPLLYVGVFVLTLGEIIYMSLASLTLIRLVPGHRARGASYSALLVLQELGRIAGGALAFPLAIAAFGLLATVVSFLAARRAVAALTPVLAPALA
jgi:hypothetical protein